MCARRELNEVYTGGVGSYALMARAALDCMSVVAFKVLAY